MSENAPHPLDLLGRTAYSTWMVARNGTITPAWPDLDPDERVAWRAAVDAAREDLAAENKRLRWLARHWAREYQALAHQIDGEDPSPFAATCDCTPWPPEGPSVECPVHGAVQAFNGASRDLARVTAEREQARATITAARNWVCEELDEIENNPDVSSGEAIWEEGGYASALRNVMSYLDGSDD